MIQNRVNPVPTKISDKNRKSVIQGALTTVALLFLAPKQISAMHIAEGLLPAAWAIGWYILALPFLIVGVRMISTRVKEDRRILPLLGLVGAVVFLISIFPIPVPVAGTSSHPCGTPLGAILLGPFISTVLGAIALLFQALFLSHGGLSTLGANIISMAVVGSFVGFGVFWLTRRFGASLFLAAFAAGIIGDWATYTMTSLELASGLSVGNFGELWRTLIIGYAPTQLPLGVIEGLFTAAVVVAIAQRRPELLSNFFAPKKTAFQGATP
ncbi:MAG: energy-coupling factor ABC transporter permease [Dehalogenimonas sp.]|uniref:Cobalt transport protein CbiM n=1 Tax=Candidatus Dehalogenimonas loeffleri TaxID=3127115 RepID=A0ABZ2JBM4_9CHLR|nr:energy-coupling factor ABC transporter permease [Dehalogenimonas sp.]